MQVVAIVILCIIVAIILLFIGATFYFYNVGIARRPKEFLTESPDLDMEQLSSLTDSAWLAAHHFEKVEMKSYDGLTLRAYYLAAKQPTAKTVILAHGYTGSALKDMVTFAQMYHEHLNFNVLMPDDRGHGESEGSYIGFGWHDRLDYVKWIYLMVQKLGPEIQIALHGLSMGGATVLMTSGEQLPEQVKCIISDCGYTSATDILSYQLRQMYKLPPFPMVYLTSLLCKLRAGYFFAEASAVRQVAKNTRPILFVHGEDDTFVPTFMVHTLYAVCHSYKELMLVPGAGHGLAYTTDKASCTDRTRMFLQKFIPEE